MATTSETEYSGSRCQTECMSSTVRPRVTLRRVSLMRLLSWGECVTLDAERTLTCSRSMKIMFPEGPPGTCFQAIRKQTCVTEPYSYLQQICIAREVCSR